MKINRKKLNPLGFHLLAQMQNPDIRNIILYGGSSSGKTYSVAQAVLIFTLWEGTNHLVMRKVGATIKDTIYQDFKTAAAQLGITHFFKFTDGVKIIKCLRNEAMIVFKGLDDAEKIKGISSFKRVIMDEWSEYDEEDYRQIRLRLRGRKGQQIIAMFNPIKETHWIKKKVFDTQQWHEISQRVTLGGELLPEQLTQVKSIRLNEPKTLIHKRTGEIIEHPSDTVVIQTTYLNNFWVIGSPDGTYGYYDEQCIATFEFDREHAPDYYNVYALGEWGVIRKGSEFFASFRRAQHTSTVAYDPELAMHICVDSNVLPYISVSYWQIDQSDGHRLRQLGETCATSPDNTVRKAAELTARRLRQWGVDRVYLHGDASTRAANNIDDAKRSFHDLFIDTLQKCGIDVIDRVGTRNPPVAMTGEFINAIFDEQFPDISIMIDQECHTSIEDYLSAQKDENGAILKVRVKDKSTGQTYEPHGHLSDTFRYIVADLMREAFTQFSNRRKRNLYAAGGAIRYYNPDTACEYSRVIAYALPNVNGRFVMVEGGMCGDKWHILALQIAETSSTDEVVERLAGTNAKQTVVECTVAYNDLIKTLRKRVPSVRVIPEAADIPTRISATSDFVKNHVLFSPALSQDNAEYAEFMTCLLDYNKTTGQNIEASAALSGFVQYVLKFRFSE